MREAVSVEELLGPVAGPAVGLPDAYKPYVQARIAEGVTATSVPLEEIQVRG
jgi:hypothetical protein